MSRTVIAYHGTGHWDAIKATGVVEPTPEDRSYAEDERALATCGGTLLTTSPEVAAAHALRASSEGYGEATVVMVEIDERLLMLDDEKVGMVLQQFLDENFPHWTYWDSVTVGWAIDSLPRERLSDLATRLGGSDSDAGYRSLVDGLTGYAHRMLDCWDLNLGVTAAAVNNVCKSYGPSVGHEFPVVVDGDSLDFVETFRTMEPIGDAPGAKIVGAATLVFEDAGMTLAEVVTEGRFPREDADRIAQAAIDRLVEEGHDIMTAPHLDISATLIF